VSEACSTHGNDGKIYITFWSEDMMGRDLLPEDLGIDGKMILELS
jgi:hypothetical protein